MYKYIKRILDFILALLALPFLFLAILLVGIAIKTEDGGPVFYCSARVGKNGRVFNMLKFRSMKMNSPDIRNADGSTYNGEGDTRVTRIGKILRKNSIDELPQLINVLIGNMSFVGPRPILADTPVSEFDDIRRKRLAVHPGITGYSQAYFRNSITQNEKFAYDCFYIDNITFRLDVKIMFKTVISAIKHDNIYVEQSDQAPDE